MKVKFFNKKEITGIVIILVGIFLLSLVNFRASLRRARDVQRRDDLTALSGALEKFYNDFEMYPPASADGKIVACLPEGVTIEDIKKIVGGRPELNKKKIFASLTVCEWGESTLEDVSDPSIGVFLSVIPKDSLHDEGYSYFYYSTPDHYQIYGAFEGKDMPEYDTKIVERSLSCGVNICNFGKASRGTPLDKSLQEYENELGGNK
jgi:hypothetical protein